MESPLQSALVAIGVTECQDNKIVPSGDGRPSVRAKGDAVFNIPCPSPDGGIEFICFLGIFFVTLLFNSNLCICRRPL